MHEHRRQADGEIRDSDNWQKGMTLSQYMKSLLRHTFQLWRLHRGYKVYDYDDGHEITVEEACNGVFFNIQGYQYETLKRQEDARGGVLSPGVENTMIGLRNYRGGDGAPGWGGGGPGPRRTS